MSMIWDNMVYKLRFNDDLSINIEEVEIVNKKTSNNVSVISLNDGHEFSVSITNDNLASITNSILGQSTITDYIFFYPDKTQLFNKVVDDLRNMKALFDKSINEISMDCIKLLNKKEELINETDTSTAKFPDNIGLGYTMYANMSGKIVKFIATNLDSRNIVVISLERKRLIMLDSNDRINDKLFLKDGITFHPTLIDAMTFGRISDIDHSFDSLQTRIDDLTSESSRIGAAIESLIKYNENKELEINTARK